MGTRYISNITDGNDWSYHQVNDWTVLWDWWYDWDGGTNQYMDTITFRIATGAGNFYAGDYVYGNGNSFNVRAGVHFCDSNWNEILNSPWSDIKTVSNVVWAQGGGYPGDGWWDEYSFYVGKMVIPDAAKYVTCGLQVTSGGGSNTCLITNANPSYQWQTKPYFNYSTNSYPVTLTKGTGIASVQLDSDTQNSTHTYYVSPNSEHTINCSLSSNYTFSSWNATNYSWSSTAKSTKIYVGGELDITATGVATHSLTVNKSTNVTSAYFDSNSTSTTSRVVKGTSKTLNCTFPEHYHFYKWVDQNNKSYTNNPLTITLDSNTPKDYIYTAYCTKDSSINTTINLSSGINSVVFGRYLSNGTSSYSDEPTFECTNTNGLSDYYSNYTSCPTTFTTSKSLFSNELLKISSISILPGFTFSNIVISYINSSGASKSETFSNSSSVNFDFSGKSNISININAVPNSYSIYYNNAGYSSITDSESIDTSSTKDFVITSGEDTYTDSVNFCDNWNYNTAHTKIERTYTVTYTNESSPISLTYNWVFNGYNDRYNNTWIYSDLSKNTNFNYYKYNLKNLSTPKNLVLTPTWVKDSSYKNPSVTKYGYTHTGWKDSSNNFYGYPNMYPTKDIEDSITLYPIYEPIKLGISIDWAPEVYNDLVKTNKYVSYYRNISGKISNDASFTGKSSYTDIKFNSTVMNSYVSNYLVPGYKFLGLYYKTLDSTEYKIFYAENPYSQYLTPYFKEDGTSEKIGDVYFWTKSENNIYLTYNPGETINLYAKYERLLPEEVSGSNFITSSSAVTSWKSNDTSSRISYVVKLYVENKVVTSLDYGEYANNLCINSNNEDATLQNIKSTYDTEIARFSSSISHIFNLEEWGNLFSYKESKFNFIVDIYSYDNFGLTSSCKESVVGDNFDEDSSNVFCTHLILRSDANTIELEKSNKTVPNIYLNKYIYVYGDESEENGRLNIFNSGNDIITDLYAKAHYEVNSTIDKLEFTFTSFEGFDNSTNPVNVDDSHLSSKESNVFFEYSNIITRNELRNNNSIYGITYEVKKNPLNITLPIHFENISLSTISNEFNSFINQSGEVIDTSNILLRVKATLYDTRGYKASDVLYIHMLKESSGLVNLKNVINNIDSWYKALSFLITNKTQQQLVGTTNWDWNKMVKDGEVIQLPEIEAIMGQLTQIKNQASSYIADNTNKLEDISWINSTDATKYQDIYTKEKAKKLNELSTIDNSNLIEYYQRETINMQLAYLLDNLINVNEYIGYVK